MDKNRRFLNISIALLRELYIDSRRFANNAFDVGIYIYSRTLEGDEAKQFKDASSFLNVTNGNIQNAKRILSDLPAKYPVVGVDRDMLFNYYRYQKTEFEIICLAAFLAIKSIIGKKPYDKTNKIMIHARMFGYTSPKELPEELTPLQKKYKTRWHMDKILQELQFNWNLKILWNHNRGIYISFDLSLDKLAEIVDKQKRKTRLQELKEEKKRAIEKAKLTTT
jgi:hypothetical protein